MLYSWTPFRDVAPIDLTRSTVRDASSVHRLASFSDAVPSGRNASNVPNRFYAATQIPGTRRPSRTVRTTPTTTRTALSTMWLTMRPQQRYWLQCARDEGRETEQYRNRDAVVAAVGPDAHCTRHPRVTPEWVNGSRCLLYLAQRLRLCCSLMGTGP